MSDEPFTLVMKEAYCVQAQRIIVQAAALCVLQNPAARTDREDLALLAEAGERAAADVAPRLVGLLRSQPAAYGKAAIVGVDGAFEHGAAVLHPRLGRPFRAAVGGGEAIICSTLKTGGPGTSIDVPLAHKDHIWSFDFLDTMTLACPTAPRPTEILLVLAVSDGPRVGARIGNMRHVV